MSKKKDIIDEVSDIINPLIIFYALYLLLLWFFNKQEFWKWVFIGLVVVVIFFAVEFLIFMVIKSKGKN